MVDAKEVEVYNFTFYDSFGLKVGVDMLANVSQAENLDYYVIYFDYAEKLFHDLLFGTLLFLL